MSGQDVNRVRLGADYKRVTDLARTYVGRADAAGVLSTGEKCAVALLCNDAGMLPHDYTFLDAVDRLGADWLVACLQANRDGWRE